MAFYERIYLEIQQFCESDNQISETLIFEYIQQLHESESTPMPNEFLENLESKMGIFKKLRPKIHDDEVKRKIDDIWKRWSRILYDKERKAEDVPRRNDIFCYSIPGTDSFLLSPSYTNTPSVPSVASIMFSPSPLTPAEDRTVENISIPVFRNMTDMKERSGFFKYSTMQSGKVVCMMEDCRVRERSRRHRTGVSLQTLRAHARKDHSIVLDIKRKRGEIAEPLNCEFCSKSFIREQTLKNHIAKLHSRISWPATPAPEPLTWSTADPILHTVPPAQVVTLNPNIFSGPQSPMVSDGLDREIQRLLSPNDISLIHNILDLDNLPAPI